jgi:hypothetical protein
MINTTKRINFKYGVSDTLYKQAGGRCSVPRCKNPTMGPFYEDGGAVNMGQACHIYSASPKGPRGRGQKNEEFISSEKNGLWCCQYHAALIDKNKGLDYPAETLFSWKNLAEARTLKQMNDIPSPLGWVESIEFTEFPYMKVLPKLTLSKNTLMWGKHGSGKTILLEIAASISNSRFADRFISKEIKNNDDSNSNLKFAAKVIYSTVDTYSKEIQLKIKGPKLVRKEGMMTNLLPQGDIEVIYCSWQDEKKHTYEDDIDFLMRVLNIDRSAFFALAEMGTSTIFPGEIKIVQAELEDEEGNCSLQFKEDGSPFYELEFRLESRAFFISFSMLSGSEQGRLVIDLLINKAREISKQRLTLLLIESLSMSFDESNLKRLLNALKNEEFQSVVSIPPAREENIIENTDDGFKLKSLEFLSGWQLSIIKSIEDH